MNRKIILWIIVAFIAGGMVAARQNIMEHQPRAHSVNVPQDKDARGKPAN